MFSIWKKASSKYCQVCQCVRWHTAEGDCVVCINLFGDDYGSRD